MVKNLSFLFYFIIIFTYSRKKEDKNLMVIIYIINISFHSKTFIEKWWLFEFKRSKSRLTLQEVKAHTNVYGNEMVDKLAKSLKKIINKFINKISKLAQQYNTRTKTYTNKYSNTNQPMSLQLYVSFYQLMIIQYPDQFCILK